MDEERVKAILKWAMRNRAEESFEEEFYYWTPEAKKILNKLALLGTPYGDCLLIGVIGRSGIGKSALIRAIEVELQKALNKYDSFMGTTFTLKWSRDFLKRLPESSVCIGVPHEFGLSHHTLLIDTPDYGSKDVRRINNDLTKLHNI